MKISVETSWSYAEIMIDDHLRNSLSGEGMYWYLRTSPAPAFSGPLKKWRETDKKKKIEDVLPECLEFILKSFEEDK